MNVPNWEKWTILVVEDDAGNTTLLNEMLLATRVQIVNAKNGLEAIKICRTNKEIKLILMDLKMPIMDGYKCIPEIKKIRADIPIIAQTALAFREDQVKAKLAGFDDYLIKPFRFNDLLEKISKYL